MERPTEITGIPVTGDGSRPEKKLKVVRRQQGTSASMGILRSTRSYAELVEIAELQRRQIEANRKEEERRNALLAARGHSMPRDLQATVKNLRREVAEGELELK
uniref:Uncharacterized protein n=1 Tax=Pristionchus pacificus TaxID=54126 RepID=A0A2A6C208_PRIPA